MTETSTARNKPILITGATGFVGSYLLRYLLQQGYRNIRAIRRKSSSMELLGPAADKVEWVEGDIVDPVFVEEAMSGIKWVFHCAAVVSFAPSQARQMRQTNGEGAANIVNAALYEGIDKLLHISSIATLGRVHNNLMLSEKDTWQRSPFNTQYGVSKYMAEQEVWRGMAEGLRVAIVNPSVILGSGKWNEGTPRIFKMAYEGLYFYPEGATGFVDVRDVARFSVQLMESDIEGERFILNAENQTYQSLLNRICHHLDSSPPSRKATSLTRAVAWRLAWLYSRLTGKPPLLTRETANQSGHSFYYENKKSLEAFPFTYHPIEQTIAETCGQLLQARQEGFASRILPFGDV
ncbi:MAG: NAD-dependent epimerase/dehydratase family protein [Lewinellaceae bacterium]|nr:NAD-dependent epimerase/dehydratase family protein [Phaeodactylibacter sp.]MCB0614485.1 NAD-dependent epimerase/dehydratase family protein [Phaeodactylibacter sp.]MCB9350089.1 NAD-dependent epimerase/dehydratase family protein [Lewinellaceae bacterium]